MKHLSVHVVRYLSKTSQYFLIKCYLDKLDLNASCAKLSRLVCSLWIQTASVVSPLLTSGRVDTPEEDSRGSVDT